jgi:hypothetical protein
MNAVPRLRFDSGFRARPGCEMPSNSFHAVHLWNPSLISSQTPSRMKTGRQPSSGRAPFFPLTSSLAAKLKHPAEKPNTKTPRIYFDVRFAVKSRAICPPLIEPVMLSPLTVPL